MAGSTRTIAGLSAAHLVTDLYGPALPAIISLLILRYGYSYFAAGLLVTVYNAVSSLVQPGIGWIHDRKGVHLPLSLSILVCGLFISLLGLAPGFGVMLLFCSIAALGHAAFHPVALSLTGRHSTDTNRGRIISYFVIGGNLGFALGPLAAGAAIEILGQGGILFMVIPALAMAMALPLLLPPLPWRRPEEVTGIQRGTGPVAWGAVAILVAAASLRSMVILRVHRVPPHLPRRAGVRPPHGKRPPHPHAPRRGRRPGPGWCGLGPVGEEGDHPRGHGCNRPLPCRFPRPSGPAGLVSLMLFGFSLWSSFSVTLAIAHEFLPGNLGLASGLLLGLSMGVGGLGVALIGGIGDAIGLTGAFWVLLGAILLAIPLFIVLPYPWRGRKPHTSPTME